jgi:hypothetical protein
MSSNKAARCAFAVVLLFLFGTTAGTAGFVVEWESLLGGPGDDGIVWLGTGGSGNLLVVGNTSGEATGGSDILLVRADARGRMLQSARFGIGGAGEYPAAGTLFADGGAAVAGTITTGGSRDLYVLRVDSTLGRLWEHRYTRALDDAYGIAPLADGSLLVLAGSDEGSRYSLLLLHLDPDGVEKWRRTLASGPGLARAGVLLAVPAGGFVVAGADDRALQHDLDLFLIRLDDEGRTLRERAYERPGTDELPSAIIPAIESGYAIAGTSGGPNGRGLYLGIFDPFLERKWDRVVMPGDGPFESAGVTARDRTYHLVGSGAIEWGGPSRVMVFEIDPDGVDVGRFVSPATDARERARATVLKEGELIVGIETRSAMTKGTDMLLRAVIPEGLSTPRTERTNVPNSTRTTPPTLQFQRTTTGSAAAAPSTVCLGIGALCAATILNGRRKRL